MGEGTGFTHAQHCRQPPGGQPWGHQTTNSGGRVGSWGSAEAAAPSGETETRDKHQEPGTGVHTAWFLSVL